MIWFFTNSVLWSTNINYQGASTWNKIHGPVFREIAEMSKNKPFQSLHHWREGAADLMRASNDELYPNGDSYIKETTDYTLMTQLYV